MGDIKLEDMKLKRQIDQLKEQVSHILIYILFGKAPCYSLLIDFFFFNNFIIS